ncbi:MAG: hypothetical protein KKB34_19955 [Bacteroidetes bacterium]|nr:hypothetical protein [Bacteroidota bacterium]
MNKFKNVFYFLLATSYLFISCKDDNPVKPPDITEPAVSDTLTISIIAVTHRSISVNVKTTNNGTGKQIQLFRKAGTEATFSLVSVYTATVLDTTIIDYNNSDGLLLDTEYSYYSVRLDSLGMPEDSSNIVSGRTLAATSHDYEWQEIVLGEFQSVLYDVWGTDENNVYAVGTVILNDTAYGIIKWNGIEWLPEKKIGGINAIYGFAENDIWAVGASVYNYDGISWNRVDGKTVNNRSVPLDSVLFNNGSYTSLWGTSSNDLYFGNLGGKIIHWDGIKASVFRENPNSYISDINGTGSGKMWIVGRGNSPFVSNYSHSGWNQIQEDQIIGNYNKSVYPFSNTDLVIGGNSLISFINNNWNYENVQMHGSIFKLRGTGSNNIFGVGAYNSIYHFNGVDWINYDNLVTPEGGILYGLHVEEKTVFIVGVNSDHITAKIIIGKKRLK